MKKILWVGDAGCPSGFARATHEILASLDYRLGGDYEVTVLGLNYRGDPHQYPYHIYAAVPGGDTLGIGRLIWMCDLVQPDLIIIQNDGWHIQRYMQQLRLKLSNGEYAFPDHAAIPFVAVLAVDGKNFIGRWLDGVALTIFWTQFALDEARFGGYRGPAVVIPLGVDVSAYRPLEKSQARGLLPAALHDKYIVGNVNRNQPRKRWDLTVKYFAGWVNTHGVDDAYLFLHAAPTGDTGYNVQQLASYYGVLDRLVFREPPIWYGIPEQEMCETYNCFDVQMSTTQGEGFGLTTFEGMACGVPQIVPGWSALGELCEGAAVVIPCSSTAVEYYAGAVIGGVPDEAPFIDALARLYQDAQYRSEMGAAARLRAEDPRYRWFSVGQQYVHAIGALMTTADSKVA